MVGEMTENLDVLFGVLSQSLFFRAPEGVPASITSTVYENCDGDDSTPESALTGSATASAVSTTVDLAAGDSQGNPLVVPLADTAGIEIGHLYLITNTAGESEFVEVCEIVAGVSIRIRHRLFNDFAPGDSFVGTHIVHNFDPSWVTNTNNISRGHHAPRYRWRLEYTAAGATQVHDAYFDLVRYKGVSTVTGADVDAAYPWLGWLNKLPVEDKEDRGARIIKEAYRQVKLRLAQAGKADEAARNREVVEDMVMHRAAYLVAGKDFEAIELISRNEEASFNNFVVTPKLDFDNDGSGSASPALASRITRR